MDDFVVGEIDKGLIAELQNSATQTPAELGNKLGVRQSTVRRHIKKLIASGAIKLIAVPNPRKVGPSYWSEFGIKVVPYRMAELAKIICDIPGVYMVATCLGRYDLLVSARFETMDRLSQFVTDDVKTLEGVIGVDPLIISKIIKYYSFVS